MPYRTQKALLIVSGLTLAAAIVSWSRSAEFEQRVTESPPIHPAAPETKAHELAFSAAAASEWIESRAVVPAPVSPQTLPPPGTPLVEILDHLESQARLGNSAAACRLTADLSTCADLARSRALRIMIDPTRHLITDAQPANEASTEALTTQLDVSIEAMATIENSMEAVKHMCEGLSERQSKDALKWLYQSASSGNTRAMAEFASGKWWQSVDTIHHPHVISAYLRDAQSMAEAAVTAGDRSLLTVYGIALSGLPQPFNRSPLSEAVKPDPVRARALLIIADREIQQFPSEASRISASAGGLSRRSALEQLNASLDMASIHRSDMLARQLQSNFDRKPPKTAVWGSHVAPRFGPENAIALEIDDCEP
jgi:hypothetical protein